MSHAHHHHHGEHCDHAHGADASTADGRKRVAAAGLLTFGFMGAEVVGGLLSGSLALLADAGHMLTDAASLALAWLGYRLAMRPADGTHTFGFGRYRILAAFANGVGLVFLAVWILFEAAGRLMDPHPIAGPLMLTVASLGLIVNLVCFAILHGGDQKDLNLSGAMWHVAGDLLGSIAAIGAAVVIMTTGWTPIDPILSALVAALIIFAGLRIIRQSARILADAAPDKLAADALSIRLLEEVQGLAKIEALHVWSLTETDRRLIMTARLAPAAKPTAVRAALQSALHEQFSPDQLTLDLRSAE